MRQRQITNVTVEGCHIEREMQQEAFFALKAVALRGESTYPYQQATTLAEILHECWKWNVTTDMLSGEVTGLVCQTQEEGNLDSLFETIEPFIDEGSVEYDRTPGHNNTPQDHVSYDFFGGVLMKLEDDIRLY